MCMQLRRPGIAACASGRRTPCRGSAGHPSTRRERAGSPSGGVRRRYGPERVRHEGATLAGIDGKLLRPSQPVPLQSFHPAIQAWFPRTFPAPTAAQAAARPTIRQGLHTSWLRPHRPGPQSAACLLAGAWLVRLCRGTVLDGRPPGIRAGAASLDLRDGLHAAGRSPHHCQGRLRGPVLLGSARDIR